MSTVKKALQKMPTIFATGFGLGYAPIAPGTFGALLGCLIVWTISVYTELLWVHVAVCILLSLACIPVCSYAEKALGGEKDNGKIVADEYLTFPICMLGMYHYWQEFWWLMPMCFVVNRIMDILKPFPAYRFQSLSSGLGITADDFISSIYALGINLFLFNLFR
ncbi:MAG: phosphatidylglycerophosphatase A [Lentisphaerae bacterium]|jgi:phosphatidylglycerophosphatase A|nr:phosphatidylglycerophosphatase A [Lentisphaerota bacterium]